MDSQKTNDATGKRMAKIKVLVGIADDMKSDFNQIGLNFVGQRILLLTLMLMLTRDSSQ